MTKSVRRVMVLAFTLHALTIAVVAQPARRHSYVWFGRVVAYSQEQTTAARAVDSSV
jgi:hypothetical protein